MVKKKVVATALIILIMLVMIVNTMNETVKIEQRIDELTEETVRLNQETKELTLEIKMRVNSYREIKRIAEKSKMEIVKERVIKVY